MERPSGKFNRLAKPAFDRNNPNAVLGEIKVPGLEQVCRTHIQILGKGIRSETCHFEYKCSYSVVGIIRVRTICHCGQQVHEHTHSTTPRR